jgi:hypothetical protein
MNPAMVRFNNCIALSQVLSLSLSYSLISHTGYYIATASQQGAAQDFSQVHVMKGHQQLQGRSSNQQEQQQQGYKNNRSLPTQLNRGLTSQHGMKRDSQHHPHHLSVQSQTSQQQRQTFKKKEVSDDRVVRPLQIVQDKVIDGADDDDEDEDDDASLQMETLSVSSKSSSTTTAEDYPEEDPSPHDDSDYSTTPFFSDDAEERVLVTTVTEEEEFGSEDLATLQMT